MMRYTERTLLLRLIDQYWKDHLLNLDKLRQGINLRAYAQRDPLNEYKQEAFSMFELMSNTIIGETVKALALFELADINNERELDDSLLSSTRSFLDEMRELTNVGIDRGEENMGTTDKETDRIIQEMKELEEFLKVRERRNNSTTFKTSRNAQCPCGSGNRYKNCCGIPK